MPVSEQTALREVATWYSERDMEPRCFVEIFGCQQNVADGYILSGSLAAMGFLETKLPEQADLILLVTCAVREHAAQKALSHLGRLQTQAKKGCLIAVSGCLAQMQDMRQRLAKRQVDLVFGPGDLSVFPELLLSVLQNHRAVIRDTDPTQPVEEDLELRRSDPPQAFVSIMKGCNNFCSYCIVPYVRGRERSREPERILNEITNLVSQGYTEFTLLGQNVNSYHPSTNMDFPDLLKAISHISGEFTLGFMTSHPKDAKLKLLDEIRDNEKIRKNLHLPVQSGSNAILKAMNRGYTRENYLRTVSELRSRVPACKLTSDIIVGFPGETEQDFQDTLDLITQVRFSSLFTFLYSPRTGTPAAQLPDEISLKVKKERFQRLLALQKQMETTSVCDSIQSNFDSI